MPSHGALSDCNTSHRRVRRTARLAAAALALALTPLAAAHSFDTTKALVLIRSDGTYQVDLTVDVDALALGVPQDTPSEEVVTRLQAMSPAEFETCVESARDMLLRRVRLRFDGEKQTPEVSFPEADSALAGRWNVPTVLGATARLVGSIPDGAREVTFGLSRAFSAVDLTVLDEAALGGARHVLVPGADSPPFVLGGEAAPSATVRPRSVVVDYLVLGFAHIVPLGLDHILFVLGLFLLSPRPRPLLLQVSAFTIAHTATLALSMTGDVTLPARLVETVIALSIVWVAAENLLTAELSPWRVLLVFAFGLLHGLGFSGALREIGLPEGEFVPALLAFNAGVELGQLAVVAAAFLVVGWFRDRTWYRPAIAWPASALIALVGLWWAIQRAVFGV